MQKVTFDIKYEQFTFDKKVLTRDLYEDLAMGAGSSMDESHILAIGKHIVEFSALEGSLSQWNIPQLIGDRFSEKGFNYKIGHSIVAKKQAMDKMMLYTELLMANLVDGRFKRLDISRKQIHQLRKMMEYATEARNVIAHADWTESVDDEWFVTKFRYNPQNGSYDYTMHNLSEKNINEATAYVHSIGELVETVTAFSD